MDRIENYIVVRISILDDLRVGHRQALYIRGEAGRGRSRINSGTIHEFLKRLLNTDRDHPLNEQDTRRCLPCHHVLLKPSCERY
jgi:hypothetical protein